MGGLRLGASLLVITGALSPLAFAERLDAAGESTRSNSSTSETRLSAIQIYGDRRENDPGALSVLDAEIIDETLADRPAEILNRVPGVNIQMNSGQEHLIAIRSPVLTAGAGQGSFLILENGVPTRAAAFGNVNSLIEPHHELARAIEVVRGPGSARYGSNAVHGLINVILPEPGGGQLIRGAYGSLDRWRGDASFGIGPAAKLNLSFLEDGGWRQSTGVSQQKASLVGANELRGWDVTGWISASNLNQETAGFIQGPKAYRDRSLARTNPNPDAFRDAWSARAAARFSRPYSEGEISLTPHFNTQAMIFSQHFLPYGGIEKNGHTHGGAMLRYDSALSGKVRWRAGSDIGLASGYLKEIQPLPNPNPAFPQGIHYDYKVLTQTIALWADIEYDFGNGFRAIAGLRGENHHYDYTTRANAGINGRFNVSANRTDRYSFLTPKLGLIWERGWGQYFANYARGARAPQVSDLYRLQNRQTPGQVRAETLDSLEVGMRGSSLGGRAGYELSVYGMEKSNFFFRDSDGLNVPDGATRHIGAEASGIVDLTDQFSLRGNISWSEQTYTFNRLVTAAQERVVRGNRIDTAPEWLANLDLIWQATDAIKLTLTASYTGEYFMDPANTATYPGHTVLGLRAAYDFDRDLEGFVIIRNLTDVAYADRADIAFGNERYFPGEPINVSVGLTRKY